jgi:hypothetical protein
VPDLTVGEFAPPIGPADEWKDMQGCRAESLAGCVDDGLREWFEEDVSVTES